MTDSQEMPSMAKNEEKKVEEQAQNAPAEVTPVAAEPQAETAEVTPTAAEPQAETAEVAPAAAEPAAETVEDAPQTAAPESEAVERPTMELPDTKAGIIARVKELAQDVEHASKQELDLLKTAFYKLHKSEAFAAQQAYLNAGGDPEKYVPQPDPDEDTYKAEMAAIKEKRQSLFLAQEEEKLENLSKKQAIIARIKEMAQTPEEANQSYNEFKELQAQWRDIKTVPADKANELWKNYQLYVEQYYDMLKLNSELREYDFKKNLEAKTHLCETAEKLADETDIIAAFRQLQQLHQDFREIGPVAKELREDIWTRFKAASTIINKKHQQHFEDLKAKEEDNLRRKAEICEKIENVDVSTLKNFAEWDGKTKEIIALQAEWKTIGFAPQKMNQRIFERFRSACDNFFQQKAVFFKALKDVQNENLIKKQALAEKAEALKDSTEWRSTSDALIQLQKEWKTIGAVPKKYSEALWKRFVAACDNFFEAKNKANASAHEEETENLTKKQAIIEKLKAVATDAKEDAQQTVRDLMNEWNAVGHVPFKEKDKLYKTYHDTVDELFKSLNMGAAQRRLSSFKSNLKDRADKAGSTLSHDRERMFRAYEAMKGEIQTYENNMGFLNSSSKSGNSLVNEMKKKVEKLKDELELLRKKIEAVDEELKKE